MDERDKALYQSFILTDNMQTFSTVVGFGIDPDKLKSFAIEILDNPKSTPQEINAARLYAQYYKKMTRVWGTQKTVGPTKFTFFRDEYGRRCLKSD